MQENKDAWYYFFQFFNHFLWGFASCFYWNIYCGKNTAIIRWPLRRMTALRVVRTSRLFPPPRLHVLNCVISVLSRIIFTLYTISTNLLRFQNGCNKVVIELRVAQFWSYLWFQIELARWNHTYDFRSNCTPFSSITIIKLCLLF